MTAVDAEKLENLCRMMAISRATNPTMHASYEAPAAQIAHALVDGTYDWPEMIADMAFHAVDTLRGADEGERADITANALLALIAVVVEFETLSAFLAP